MAGVHNPGSSPPGRPIPANTGNGASRPVSERIRARGDAGYSEPNLEKSFSLTFNLQAEIVVAHTGRPHYIYATVGYEASIAMPHVPFEDDESVRSRRTKPLSPHVAPHEFFTFQYSVVPSTP